MTNDQDDALLFQRWQWDKGINRDYSIHTPNKIVSPESAKRFITSNSLETEIRNLLEPACRFLET